MPQIASKGLNPAHQTTNQTRTESSRIPERKRKVTIQLNKILGAAANSALCSSADSKQLVCGVRCALQPVYVGSDHRTRDKTRNSRMFYRNKVHRTRTKLTKLKIEPFYSNLVVFISILAMLQFIQLSDRRQSLSWPPQAECTTASFYYTLPQQESSSQRVGQSPSGNKSVVAPPTIAFANSNATHNQKKSSPSMRSGPQIAVIKAASLPASMISNSAPRRSWSTKRLASGDSTGQQEPTREFMTNAQQQQQQQQQQRSPAGGDLQLSITTRVNLVRVPVESNAILKCLISSQSASKLNRKLDIHWSRYMYDENVYEQIESFGSMPDHRPPTELSLSGGGELSGAATESAARRTVSSPEQTDLIALASNQDDRSILFNRQQQLREFLNRARQETNSISDLLIEARLSISPVKATDNATYYCTATDGLGEQSQARIDLVALSRPIVLLQRVQPARDSKSALIYWLVASDGNTPIKRTILMVRNDTGTNSAQQNAAQLQPAGATAELGEQQQFSSSVVLDSDYNQWQRIDIAADGEEPLRHYSSSSLMPANGVYGGELGGVSVVRADLDITSSAGPASSGRSASNPFQASNADPQAPSSAGDTDGSYAARRRWRHGRLLNKGQRFHNLTGLLPGVTYNVRLAAINDMGQSNWTYLTSTMPNEIPAQISEMFLLARQNDSLAIGWRRPIWDNSKTIRYEMQLFDLNRTLTLDANTNTTTNSPAQTKFMYIFVNLNPGSDYHFHVRACSRAGCSAFSSPKLLASTLDGEPDEPLDVELNCRLSIGAEIGANNVSVTWLPPVNARGHLLNYSVAFDSYARYRNQSGLWQVDEWRSSLETSDNHTFSLETRGILQPNTNYTVRVCANNRSKQCGKQSSLTARTQCSTMPELPAQLPTDLRLTFAKRAPESSNSGGGGGDGDQPSAAAQSSAQNIPNGSLLLELPFISQRNGSIHCIQVVLIKLPNNYSNASMGQFLPEEARDIKLSSPSELQAILAESSETSDQVDSGSTMTKSDKNKQQAIAYVAEELDQTNWWPPTGTNVDHNQSPKQQVVLGDGKSQLACPDLNNPSTSTTILDKTASERSKRRPAYDAQLKPLTYYTGFIRLMLIRPREYALENGSGTKSSEPPHEVLIKYSNYFNPVRTGETVLELISAPDGRVVGEEPNAISSANPFYLADYSQMSFQEMAARLSLNVRSSLSKLYNSSSVFVADNVRLEALSNFITQSSPLMQVLELGILVLLGSLFILFFIYIVTLPTSARRKRTRKMKRQLQKHQEANTKLNMSEAAYLVNETGCESTNEQPGLMGPASTGEPANMLAQNGGAAYHELGQSSLGQQQVPLTSGAVYQQAEVNIAQHHHQLSPAQQQQQQLQQHHSHRECPIHSSPSASKHHSPAHFNGIENQEHNHHHFHNHHHHQQQHQHQHQQQPRSSINVSNSKKQQSGHYHSVYPAANQEGAIYKQQQEQHSSYQQQAHLSLVANHQSQMSYAAANHEQHYERNCRTVRRAHPGNNQQAHYATAANTGGSIDADLNSLESSKNHHFTTMSNQNSVLALAKKINKSIPLRLFGAVFECRLRNNWLREEYEQLPRPQLWPPTATGRSAHMLIKLRPQLIVSRNDCVSALISGNELFDASCVSANLPLLASSNGVSELREKRIICAKSPLDADSVWDFWRLVYEQEVSTIVMLTQNEDPNTGELRCAQYWPTCDNEETTILSPCNEHVQKSTILPAKFKIRQETLSADEGADDFKVRQLTLIVMASRPGENEPAEEQLDETTRAGDVDDVDEDVDQAARSTEKLADKEEDEESLIIVERTILHLQFGCWNTSTLANQMRLIKFIERANERHLRTLQALLDSPGSTGQTNNPMLVHCSNGIGRSGLFAAMSFVIEDLSVKLSFDLLQKQPVDQQQHLQRLNLFQLVARLRAQREMLLSPYRLYELLYQLTSNCIPMQERPHPLLIPVQQSARQPAQQVDNHRQH